MLQIFALSLTLAGTTFTATTATLATQSCFEDIRVSQSGGSGRTVYDNGMERRWPANAACTPLFETIDGLWDNFRDSPETKAYLTSDESYALGQAHLRYSRAHCLADDLTPEEAQRCVHLKEDTEAAEAALCESDAYRNLIARPELGQIEEEIRAAEQHDCYLPSGTQNWPQ